MYTCKKTEKRGAFTLLELLVVIAIIGILMGLLFPAFSNMRKKARRTQAETTTKAISGAIKAYFGEYGRMPGGKQVGFPDHVFLDFSSGGDDGSPMSGALVKQSVVMNILRGIDIANNPNRVVYLDVPPEDLTSTEPDLNGHVYLASEGFYLDPWGNPYIIVMDLDFDGQLGGFSDDLGFPTLESHINGLSPDGNGTFPGSTVAVISYGPDPGEVSSFIVTW